MENYIKQAKQGDERAIEKIVSQYKGLVRSYANKFFLVGGDKDDLLQEGMIGLFCAITNYDESKGSFPSFVQLCVSRQIYDAVRADAGVKNKPLLNHADIEEALNLTDGVTPLESLIEKEYFAKIYNIMETKLSPLEKSVITLFANGFSYEDIMTKTDKIYKAIDGAMKRARKKLQTYMD